MFFSRFPRYQKEIKKESEKVGLRYEEVATLEYKDGRVRFPLIKISTEYIQDSDKILAIFAGIHGNEYYGSISLYYNLGRIVNYAKEKGVKLIIFPCINPSGYHYFTRYNIEDEKRLKDDTEFREKIWKGNNNLIWYLTEKGWVDDLGASEDFIRWELATHPDVGAYLPTETRALHEQFHKLPLNQIKGVLDLHQDLLDQRRSNGTYAYVLNPEKYLDIMYRAGEIVPILRNAPVHIHPEDEDDPLLTDKDGFLGRPDGTLDDYCNRLGIPRVACVEILTGTPFNNAKEVYWIWIKEFIDKISQMK